MIGEMVALLVGEHVNLLDRLGVLGGGGARTERGREIDGRATRVLYSTVREKKRMEIDDKPNRSLVEGKGRPIDSRRLS